MVNANGMSLTLVVWRGKGFARGWKSQDHEDAVEIRKRVSFIYQSVGIIEVLPEPSARKK